MRGLSGEKSLLRRLNRAAIVRLVWENPGVSRSGVAERMGVTKSTVSQLVATLQLEGWLSGADESVAPEQSVTSEAGLSSSGRPSIPLYLNTSRFALIGVELGFETISVVAVDPYGNVLARAQARGDRRVTSALKRLQGLVLEVLGSPALLGRRVLGTGVGVPGPVDVSQGLLLHAPNLGWRNTPLQQMLLEQHPDWERVFVDNDANLAVFAEYMFGAHRHSADLLYLYLGAGIGGGLILEHHLYRGQRGFAGEIGHITINPNGRKCSCGNRGCAETLCSWRAVKAAVSAELNRDVCVSDVLEALRSGDLRVQRIVASAGRALGMFLSNLGNIFDPKLMIVGGPIADLGAYILEPALKEMHRRLFGDEFRDVRLEACAFGADACAIGAAGYAFHELLQRQSADLPTLE
jgi:predicted NBD/HSP70 family sugar kinase